VGWGMGERDQTALGAQQDCARVTTSHACPSSSTPAHPTKPPTKPRTKPPIEPALSPHQAPH